MKIAVSHVWKPPEADPGALRAGAHGYETALLRVGWLPCRQEKRFLLPLAPLGLAADPQLGFLASGGAAASRARSIPRVFQHKEPGLVRFPSSRLGAF